MKSEMTDVKDNKTFLTGLEFHNATLQFGCDPLASEDHLHRSAARTGSPWGTDDWGRAELPLNLLRCHKGAPQATPALTTCVTKDARWPPFESQFFSGAPAIGTWKSAFRTSGVRLSTDESRAWSGVHPSIENVRVTDHKSICHFQIFTFCIGHYPTIKI